MITGKPPFGGSGSSVMRKHIREEPPDVKKVKKDVPDAAAFIVRKIMAKDPDERYQSTQELFEDLEMVKIGQEPLSQREEIGRSTIIRAMRLERSRLQRALDEREKLESAVSTIKVMLYFSVGLNAILALVVILVILLGR
jgi:serine/threonine protein kinase